MAQVRLDRHQAEDGYLPPVCMRCGAPATCQRRKHFKKATSTRAVILTWIVAPLCGFHRWHWVFRRLAMCFAFLFFGAAYCSGLLANLLAQIGLNGVEGLSLSIALALGGCIVPALWLQRTSLRVIAVGTGDLLLNGVAQEFVEALAKYRASVECAIPLALPGVEHTRRQVRLFRDEVESLPMVCICCGELATHRIRKKYRTRIRHQATAGEMVLGALGAVGGIVQTGTGEVAGTPWRLQLPVCERHRTYWRNRYFVILGGFLVPVVAIGLSLGKVLPSDLSASVIHWSLGAFVCWTAVSIFLYERSNNVADATERSLVLRYVSERFVQSLEQQRTQGMSSMAPVSLGRDTPSTDIQADPS
jgi:hypothetical protein